MGIVAQWRAVDNEHPVAHYASVNYYDGRPALVYSASAEAQKVNYFSAVAPDDIAAPFVLDIDLFMASATAGVVGFAAAIEAIAPGDNHDLRSNGAYFAPQSTASVTVPAAVGTLFRLSVPVANDDGLVAGRYFRVAISRLTNDGVNDTAIGDARVLGVALRGM